METYADATKWLLAPTEHRTIRGMRLEFYLTDYSPHLLHSIGDAVAESRAERWELTARTEAGDYASKEERQVSRQRLMSFVGACPVAFRRLTSLTLHNVLLRNSEVHHLLNTCDRLEVLSLHCCESVGAPFLQIDAPSSSLVALELHYCYYFSVQLTRVPNLERVLDNSNRNHPNIYFMLELGGVPRLRDINLSADHLLGYKDLNTSGFSAFFGNLRHIYLCDLNTHRMAWTLFILEAAPFLEKLSLKKQKVILESDFP
ncbi:uncharacterized protein [Aegilops tauschii subsp. strangulata]|uniref:uncharacterized protein n=1 Tax=Aegilops tauschii subsp. strangulata TaxID=200361 RepID=UPI001ABC7AC0|nr:uncharacterized protein LOC109768480 [Aegilops tauschii subsp. strangulata]